MSFWTKLVYNCRHRHLVVFLCFLSFIICNIDRVNISVAIIPISEEYHWHHKTTQGFILSSFFYGYATTQILGGYLSDRFGGRRILSIGVFLWSLMTILTPFAASSGLWILILIRVLMGIGEGVAMPSMNSCIAHWVPKYEKSRSLSWIYSGMYFGSVLGFIVSPKIIDWWNWRVIFYIFGVIGILWTVIWLSFVKEFKDENDLALEIHDERVVNGEYRKVYDSETSSLENSECIDLHLIGQKESKISEITCVDDQIDENDVRESLTLRHVVRRNSNGNDNEAQQPPLTVLMTNKVVWVIIFAHLTSSYGFFVVLTWLPTFFNKELGLAFTESSILSATPYVAMFIFANIGGYIADHLVQRRMSVTNVRRFMQTIGFIGPAVFLLAVAYAPNATFGVIFMTIALGLSSFSQSGVYSSHQDIGPKCAGILLGITNTFATLSGIVGVAVTGIILDVTNENWKIVFAIPITLYLLGMIVYDLGITGNRIF